MSAPSLIARKYEGRSSADRPPAHLEKYILLVVVLAALGIGLRLHHYFRNPDMWQDEAIIVVNLMSKNFQELLGTLLLDEAAPPLFLWIEKAVYLTLGDSTHALRLAPVLAGCCSMLLMVFVARRVLRVRALPWALLLFACSDRLLWHACEAKPYTFDTCNAAAVLALFCGTRSWSIGRRLALFTLVAPFVIFLSYPGCFLCGGLLVALLPDVWRSLRGESLTNADSPGHPVTGSSSHYCPSLWLRSRPLLGYALLTLAVFGSFALLFVGPIQAQRNEAQTHFWVHSFPAWERPWTLPWWLARMTVSMVDYSLRPAGGLLLGLAFVGAGCLWRRRLRAELILLVLPIFLAMTAACIKAYPYEGSRLMAYAIPAIVLLVAEGAAPSLRWLRQWGERFHAAEKAWLRHGCAYLLPGMLYVSLLLPLGLTLYRLAVPWNRPDYARASAFVLAHRLPSDNIAGDCWQHFYYFRHAGAVFPVAPLKPDARLWLLITGAKTMEERLKIARQSQPGAGAILEHKEFANMTVLLMDWVKEGK